MDEELFTRDSKKKSAGRRVEPENTTRSKSIGDKLKNEDSAKQSYRRKLRHGKKDNRMSKDEAKKLKRQRYQGRKKTYADEALRAKARQTLIQNEDDNVGTDALDAGIGTAEVASSKLKSTMDMSKAKSGSDKAKADNYSGKLHGRKAKAANEAAKSSAKQAEKNLMQKEFLKAAYQKQAAENANTVGNIMKKFTDKAEDLMGRLGEWILENIADNPVVLFIAVIILIVVLVLSGALTSCSSMMAGSQNIVVDTSFTAQDDQIVAVENDYVDLEEDLQDTIDNIETDHPGYDEYNYQLAEISHNPFELAALFTVLYEDYTESEVQTMLQTIFDYQYTLDIEEVVEVRTRTETRTGWRWVSTGVVNGVATGYWESYQYDVEVQYNYYILNTTLTNNGIQAAVNALGLTEEQLERYQILLETQGNKPDIFGDNPYAVPGVSDEYQDYAIPGEYMTDQQFANMILEAEKYLGYPYVWGGSSPSTSFDCSGFVSYVINNCGNGWNVGSQTANGLKNCTARVQSSDVQPGDLIFFQGTYSTSGASHVGIVVDPVNKIMIHCGNPIQYASYDTSYWRQHFYCYGRIQ